MLKRFVLLSLLAYTPSLLAQPDSLWSRLYFGNGIDNHWHENFHLTPEGDLLFIRENSGVNGENVNYLTRVDTSGNLVSANQIRGAGAFFNIQSMTVGLDGVVALTGGSPLDGPNCDVMIYGCTAEAENLFIRRYINAPSDHGLSIIPASGGGYVVAGYYGRPLNEFDTDLLLIRTDMSGEPIWMKTLGIDRRNEAASTVAENQDNGFYVGGSVGQLPLIACYSDSGEVLWAQTYNQNAVIHALVPLSNGGLAVGVIRNQEGGSDGWMLRFDDSGDELWSKNFGGRSEDWFNDAILINEYNLVLAGGTMSWGAGRMDYWLVKTTIWGEEIWSRTFGGDDDDIANAVVAMPNGNFALIGNSNSFGMMLGSVWLVMAGPDRHQPVSFTMRLSTGWNLVSSIIQPDVGDQEVVWRQVIRNGNLDIVKDQAGHFFLPNRFNNVPEWNVTNGYLAKLSEDDSLLIFGHSVNDASPIPLRQGWNIAAYFPYENLPADQALRNLGDNLLIAKDEDGQFFLPELNFNNMGRLYRGKGYQLKVREADTLIWAMRGDNPATAPVGPDPLRHFSPVERSGGSMSLLVEYSGAKGELGVFTAAELCVGAGVLGESGPPSPPSLNGIAIWADDPTTPLVDGALEGESLRFRLWEGGRERAVEVRWKRGAGVYQTDEIAVGELYYKDVSLEPKGSIAAILVTPNPFNSVLSVRVKLSGPSKVTLRLYDQTGSAVAELFNGPLAAGEWNFRQDAAALPSGVYVLRLASPTFNLTEKVVLLR